LDPLEVQQYVPVPQNNESMLPSRPSFVTRTNIFGEIWTTHNNLGFSCISSKSQTFRFHTPRFMQKLEANLDEHKKVAGMFQHVAEYNV
jgi:hypothetical protein